MIIFSKYLQFLGQIWPQNLATIVLKDCYNCCMPNFPFSETRLLGKRWQGYVLSTLHRQRYVREGVIYIILATLLG